ncbi:MAG: cysteine--tRNA ligase [Parcubacteria group bacterium]|jgi:cysteinyl-tRNA synthetase|nr:cysteine--tRNA ligase [Parcubacteria group bacterium]
MFLYNTLSHKKETFKPIKKNQVSFYHCGPTVYWTQHLGNLRATLWADLVVRIFKYLGYQVTHVRNYTDVGHLTSDQDEGQDKIEQSAQQEKITPEQIAEKYVKIFEQDTKELNILEPTHKPRATQYIQEIQEMTQILLDKSYAYSTDLAVYFNTSKAKNYTQLSGQKIEDKLKGAGKAEVSDPNKKHPADFALWFFKAGRHKNALQTWASPWGQGFPGWHIECSVMSKKYLGATIDIHMGGIEHIPVHHTNEIAQSESANGVKFVNYWLHNEHLLVDNKKMSKSAGTGYSLAQVKQKGFNPLALRYLFLQAHYRSKQNFTWPSMEAAQKGLNNLLSQIKELGDQAGKVNQVFQDKFIEKISDDFNLPQALVIAQEVLKSDLTNQAKLATLLDFDQVLGLNLNKKQEIKIPQEITKLVQEREQARKNEEFKKADEIRDKIEKKNYQVEDTAQGPKISPKY